ncbi:MAG TPA: chemotaxis protein CheW [Gammaproteobacteria bacterium]
MQPVREVYSLLMPVKDGRIIVPRAAVAEVMGYSKPKNRPENAPDYVLGFIEWQGQQIPLISYEAARGQGVPELGRRTRIAVVFGIGGRLKPDVFAVVTQGYPYLVRVNENVLQSEAMEADEPLVLARVRMANEKPYIPNLERLETMIADGLGLSAADAEEFAPAATVDELDAPDVGDEEEFGAGILEDDDAGTASFEEGIVEEGIVEESGAEEADVDLGEVTAFGTETNHSSELDALSEALETNEAAVTEEDEAGESVDLEEVTAFGVETNYSAELGELSEALQDQGGDSEEASQESDDSYSLDLSGLELESEESTEDAAPADTSSDEESDDDAVEIDISDLEFDLDDDDKKEPN